MAIEAAQGELILQMDADELVDEELKNFCLKIAKNLKKETNNAWYVKRKNYFLGTFLKKGGQYPDSVIRLFKKGKAHLPCKDVHEQMEVEGQVGMTEGHFLHYSNPDFQTYLHKFNTYTTFKSLQMKEEGVKINFFNFFNYVFLKPKVTFFSLYLRHKGFADGWAGFVFAYFSGFYWLVSYIKYYEKTLKHD
jgi:hypothetical protein